MINRLYLTLGWTTATWYGDGGGSNWIGTTGTSGHLPANLTEQMQGSISYINAGDVISLDYTGDPAGHAGIINNNSGSTYNIINQNTAQVTSSAYISAGTLSGGNASLHMNAWAGYTVKAIISHPVYAPPPTKPLRIGALFTNGDYQAKESSLSAGWVDISPNSVTQGLQDGALTGVVRNGGGDWTGI